MANAELASGRLAEANLHTTALRVGQHSEKSTQLRLTGSPGWLETQAPVRPSCHFLFFVAVCVMHWQLMVFNMDAVHPLKRPH